jgi:hypothetical protein
LADGGSNFIAPPGGFRDSGPACVLIKNVRARGEMVLKTLSDLPAEFEYESRNLSLHPQAYKP